MKHKLSDEETDYIYNIINSTFSIEIDEQQSHFTFNLDKLMKLFKVTGLSIAVIDDFKIAWTKGLGFIEKGSSLEVTPQTLFQAGSISKPVAAAGALGLVEQGLISLDENVNNKLINWTIPENEYTKNQKVTLRRLLSHSAGLNVHGFSGYTLNETLPTLIQILDGENPANTAPVRVQCVPGSKWSYSGGGILIVQQLMIDVTNESFPKLMDNLVFSKIGMLNSTFVQPLPSDIQNKAASGTFWDGNTVPGRWHVYPEMAAGGLWTTPSDLAKFLIEIALSKNGKSNKLMSQTMANEMLKVQVDLVTEFTFGNEDFPDRMGLGFFLGDSTRSTLFGHTGDDAGFQASFLMDSKTGKGAVIMSNSEFGVLIGDFIIEQIASEYKWENYKRSNRMWIGLGALVLEMTKKNGIDFALNQYQILTKKPEFKFETNKNTLISLGYILLSNNQIQAALKVMKLETQLYPSYWNAYDSLAEVYMNLGNNSLAIENYKKSIELNQDNNAGIENLKKLQRES